MSRVSDLAGPQRVSRSALRERGVEVRLLVLEEGANRIGVTEHANERCVGHGCRAAHDRNGTAVDQNSTRRVAADNDVIVRLIADDRQGTSRWGK